MRIFLLIWKEGGLGIGGGLVDLLKEKINEGDMNDGNNEDFTSDMV